MGQYQYSLTLILTLRTQDYFSLCHKDRHDSIFNPTNFWRKKLMKKIDEKILMKKINEKIFTKKFLWKNIDAHGDQDQ